MNSPARAPTDWSSDKMQRRIRKRYSAERRFKWLGLGAVAISIGFLALLLVIMMGNGLRGFTATQVSLDVLLNGVRRRPVPGTPAPRRRSGVPSSSRTGPP